jgi:hypothetical protein
MINKKNLLILIVVLVPMGLAVAWAVNRLFFSSEDTDEGNSKWWNSLRFWKPKPVEYNTSNIINMDYKIINIVAQLAKHPVKKYGKRNLSQITQVVIHHSATKSSAIGSRPEVYARYHVDTRGWAGIGYHFVIQPDGTIYQTNELGTVSNHVQNANTKSIGICFSGNFDEEQPTEAAYNGAIWLVRALSSQFGQQFPIKAHNQYATHKSCPGAAIDIESFTKQVHG